MYNSKLLNEKQKIMEHFINNQYKRNFFTFSTPMTFSFLITRRCNLKCKHCFNNDQNKFNDNELTIKEYDELSRNLGNFSSALFCGGEPFIRDDFYEIVNCFRKNSQLQWASTTTNGQLTKSIINQTEKICSSYPSRKFVLNFSLDGYKNEHDYIRGEGTYDKCINTIKQVQKLKEKFPNLQIGLVSTLSTINEKILDEFFEKISFMLHPDVISLLLVRQHPRSGDKIKKVNIENYIKAKNKLNFLFKENMNGDINSPTAYYPLSFYEIIENTLKTGKREFYCYAGIFGAFIDYNGDVSVCEVFSDKNCTCKPKIMGNLRKYNMNFSKLWNSKNASEIRNNVNYSDCCLKCTHETEGILPSIYFQPNSKYYLERMKFYEQKLK